MSCHRTNTTGLLLLATGLLCAVVAAGCGRRAFPQSLNLDSDTRVIVEDAWVLAHTPRLLDVICVYEGVNPNRAYDLTAALSSDPKGPFHGGGWTRQLPIPQEKATNQFRVLWQFGYFPKDTAHIYFHLSYRDKETGHESALDFKLPGTRHLRVRKMGSQ